MGLRRTQASHRAAESPDRTGDVNRSNAGVPAGDRPEVTDEEILSRREERHLFTVTGPNAVEWWSFCAGFGDGAARPLFIELNTRTLFFVAVLQTDPTDFVAAVEAEGWEIVRRKRLVSEVTSAEAPAYYEAHIKFEGNMRGDLRLTSRDLYRRRWYLTKRSPKPIDVKDFARRNLGLAKASEHVGTIVHACVDDTNPQLDAGWYEGR